MFGNHRKYASSAGPKSAKLGFSSNSHPDFFGSEGHATTTRIHRYANSSELPRSPTDHESENSRSPCFSSNSDCDSCHSDCGGNSASARLRHAYSEPVYPPPKFHQHHHHSGTHTRPCSPADAPQPPPLLPAERHALLDRIRQLSASDAETAAHLAQANAERATLLEEVQHWRSVAKESASARRAARAALSEVSAENARLAAAYTAHRIEAEALREALVHEREQADSRIRQLEHALKEATHSSQPTKSHSYSFHHQQKQYEKACGTDEAPVWSEEEMVDLLQRMQEQLGPTPGHSRSASPDPVGMDHQRPSVSSTPTQRRARSPRRKPARGVPYGQPPPTAASPEHSIPVVHGTNLPVSPRAAASPRIPEASSIWDGTECTPPKPMHSNFKVRGGATASATTTTTAPPPPPPTVDDDSCATPRPRSGATMRSPTMGGVFATDTPKATVDADAASSTPISHAPGTVKYESSFESGAGDDAYATRQTPPPKTNAPHTACTAPPQATRRTDSSVLPRSTLSTGLNTDPRRSPPRARACSDARTKRHPTVMPDPHHIASIKREGDRFIQANQYGAGIERYTAALRAADHQECDKSTVVRLLCSRAAAYRAAGRVLESAADCCRAHLIDRLCVRALELRSEAFLSMGAYDLAVEDLGRLSSSTACRARVQEAKQRAALGASRNHYNVLGVKHSASVAQIKSAYRALALKLHPDKARDSLGEKAATTLFSMLSAAHSTLLNAESRRAYDLELLKQRYAGSGSSSTSRRAQSPGHARGFDQSAWATGFV